MALFSYLPGSELRNSHCVGCSKWNRRVMAITSSNDPVWSLKLMCSQVCWGTSRKSVAPTTHYTDLSTELWTIVPKLQNHILSHRHASPKIEPPPIHSIRNFGLCSLRRWLRLPRHPNRNNSVLQRKELSRWLLWSHLHQIQHLLYYPWLECQRRCA